MNSSFCTGLIVLALSIYSCGLETDTSSLPDPPIDYSTQNSTYLTFTYRQTPSVSSFQGFRVYYKVYASASNDFSKLLADRDLIWASPTISNLQNNGYNLMLFSKYDPNNPVNPFNPINNPSSVGTSPISLISGMNDGDIIKIDTLDFENQNIQLYNNGPQVSGEIMEPLIKFSESPALYAYRTIAIPLSKKSFWSIPLTSNNIDFYGNMADSKNEYVINIFVVSYGLTNLLVPVTSRPIPWGVLGPFYYIQIGNNI